MGLFDLVGEIVTAPLTIATGAVKTVTGVADSAVDTALETVGVETDRQRSAKRKAERQALDLQIALLKLLASLED